MTDKQDGTRVYSGGCDNTVRMFNMQTGQSTEVLQHGAPVKCVLVFKVGNEDVLATASWDQKLKVCHHHYVWLTDTYNFTSARHMGAMSASEKYESGSVDRQFTRLASNESFEVKLENRPISISANKSMVVCFSCLFPTLILPMCGVYGSKYRQIVRYVICIAVSRPPDEQSRAWHVGSSL